MQSSPVCFILRRGVCCARALLCVFIIVLQSTRRSCYSNDLTCVRATGVLASIEIQSSLFDGREEKGVVCFWRRKKMPERSRRRHRPERSPTRNGEARSPGNSLLRVYVRLQSSSSPILLLGGIPPECFTSSKTIQIFSEISLNGKNAFETVGWAM